MFIDHIFLKKIMFASDQCFGTILVSNGIRILRFTSLRIRLQIRVLCTITLSGIFILSLFKFASFLGRVSCYLFEVNCIHLDKY
jgi:hypothetical protein